MTDEQLREIRERASAALPGPWRKGVAGNWRIYGPDGTDGTGLVANYCRTKDLEFAYHARTDIPAMLDEIDRLKRSISSLEAALESARTQNAPLYSDRIANLERKIEWLEEALGVAKSRAPAALEGK